MGTKPTQEKGMPLGKPIKKATKKKVVTVSPVEPTELSQWEALVQVYTTCLKLALEAEGEGEHAEYYKEKLKRAKKKVSEIKGNPVEKSKSKPDFPMTFDGLLSRLEELSPSSTIKPKPKEVLLPRTQKAKGVTLLQTLIPELPSTPIKALVTRDEEIEVLTYTDGQEEFARPCPKVPFPGFVESRVVKSKDDIRQVLRETLEADPEGEVMLQPVFKCKSSGIWTPDQLSIGMENDGATSGNPFVKFFLSGKHRFSKEQLESAGIRDPEVPYVELLRSGSSLYCAQFRSGPKVPRALDYIPSTTLVKRVIHATGDNLEWGRAVLTLGEGDVAYREGDSLTSHFAAHCMTSHIPYITTRVPVVGETLVPVPLPPYDMDAIRGGILWGLKVELNDTPAVHNAAKFAIWGTHMASLWREGDSAWALGMAAAFLVRVGSVLCANESKYAKKKPTSKALECIVKGTDRDTIYNELINKALARREALISALDVFVTVPMGGSYGGIKWATAAAMIVDLNNLITSVADGRKKAVPLMIKKMHDLINACHNGGPLFNKVGIHQNVLDQAASNDMIFTINAAFGVSDLWSTEKAPRYGLTPIKQSKYWVGDSWSLPKAKPVKPAKVKIMQIRWLGKEAPSHKTHFRLQVKPDAVVYENLEGLPAGLTNKGNMGHGGNASYHEKSYDLPQLTPYIEEINELAVQPSLAGTDAKYAPLKLVSKSIMYKPKDAGSKPVIVAQYLPGGPIGKLLPPPNYSPALSEGKVMAVNINTGDMTVVSETQKLTLPWKLQSEWDGKLTGGINFDDVVKPAPHDEDYDEDEDYEDETPTFNTILCVHPSGAKVTIPTNHEVAKSLGWEPAGYGDEDLSPWALVNQPDDGNWKSILTPYWAEQLGFDFSYD